MRNTRSYASLAVLLSALASCGGAGSAPRPNILLVTLDTTRADRLSVYGYERGTSPQLVRLARESTVYTRAYSTASWTLPAHASLFTGKLPTSHGARYDPEGPLLLSSGIDGPESWDKLRARGLAQGEATLAGALAEAGYDTAGIVAGPWLKRVFGLDGGFAHWDDTGITEINGRPAKGVTDAALTWLEGRSNDAPFFLFLNYFDAHGPLAPPQADVAALVPAGVDPRRDLDDDQRNALLYDAEIHAVDRELGRLIEHLRSSGVYADTWILVTADHGELFGENGRYGHGVSVSEPEVRVPLIVKEPGASRGRRDEDALVQITDILPTILARLDLRAPEDIQGEVLGNVSHPIIAEAYPLDIISTNGDWRALFEGTRKYAWNSKDLGGLFELDTDPYEHTNLIATDPAGAEAMRARLEAYLATLPPPGDAGPERRVDPSTAKGLSNLGYAGNEEETKDEED